ncbi:MAG: hypothetical protein ACREEZ_07840, partial [Stellaceae bacterium]
MRNRSSAAWAATARSPRCGRCPSAAPR